MRHDLGGRDTNVFIAMDYIILFEYMRHPASRTVDDFYARIGTQKLSPVSSDGLRNSLVYSFIYLD